MATHNVEFNQGVGLYGIQAPTQKDDLLLALAYQRLGDPLIADLISRLEALLDAETELTQTKRDLGLAKARLDFLTRDAHALLASLESAHDAIEL
jgi:hypothetical protein